MTRNEILKKLGDAMDKCTIAQSELEAIRNKAASQAISEILPELGGKISISKEQADNTISSIVEVNDSPIGWFLGTVKEISLVEPDADGACMVTVIPENGGDPVKVVYYNVENKEALLRFIAESLVAGYCSIVGK